MDLRERTDNGKRHPWELARVQMLQKIFSSVAAQGKPLRVLDIGCGDGFILGALAADVSVLEAHGVDVNLPEDFSTSRNNAKVRFFRDVRGLTGKYDIILLCDVLEHVEDDVSFLRQIIDERAVPDALFIITVPAYQSLMSSHDAALGHYRRYAPKALIKVLDRAGLCVLDRGSMFFGLLLFRSIAYGRERLLGVGKGAWEGVGRWQAASWVTWVITGVLSMDNVCLWGLSRIKIYLPGLTCWVVARRTA